jgi:hypothetical protein
VALAFGSRLIILGAAIGALLGLGILRFLPGNQDNGLWLVVPIGLAVLFALGAGIFRGFIGLITNAAGAFAGGAIVLAGLDHFGLNFGVLAWFPGACGGGDRRGRP